MPKYTNPPADFQEVDRLTISSTTDIVLSKVLKEDRCVGYSLNKYVTTEEYTGFAKGIFIPPNKLDDFLSLFNTIR